MNLFVVRHGEAESLKSTDAARALTARGVADAQALGRFLAYERLVQWDAVICSPYVRAQQTARHILSSFPGHPPVQLNACITPDNTVAEACAVLAPLADKQCVLMVSHMPLVSALLATLVSGTVRDTSLYPMSTASMAEITLDTFFAGSAHLQRLLSPSYHAL